MAKIEPFEKYEEQFEDWYERNKLTYESELKAIKEQLPKSNNGIEIGVGTGRFAAPLGIKVGVEPSSKMRAIAQQRGIKVVGGVAEALPFDDSQFDFALMVTTICFLDDIEIAFKEVYRVLKPNGCLVIGFIDKDSPIGKLYNQHKEDNVFYKIATFYSIKEVISCLKQTIFHEIAEIKDVEPIKDGYGEGSFVVIKAMN
jgi:ubiquinone/menaquinone biosynthesis C-methylase UbiE